MSSPLPNGACLLRLILTDTGGFFGNTGANSSYAEYDLVIIPEGNGLNNTLASDHACPGDKSEG